MEEAQEMKEKGVVQDWTVIVEGFLLFPVCLAGFLLNIVRWPVIIPHQAASLTKTLSKRHRLLLHYRYVDIKKKHFFVARQIYNECVSPSI